jgi:type III secretion protein U
MAMVLAKGEGLLAERMIQVAQNEGIPIMQNIPLAHDLFEHAVLEHDIPLEFIEPIAEVLRWVRELQARDAP